MMRRSSGVLVLVLAVGCASSELRQRVDDQARRVLVLQRSIANAQTRIDELANQVSILALAMKRNGGAEKPRLSPASTKDKPLEKARDPRAKPGPSTEVSVEDETAPASLSVTKVRRRIVVPTGDEVEPRKSSDPATTRETESEETPSPRAAVDAPPSSLKPHVASPPPRSVYRATTKRKTDGDVERAYASARRLFGAKRFIDAITAFDAIVKRYPDHPLAENSAFWIGSSFYERGEWALAIAEFDRVLSRFASGRKSADAIFRAGQCHWRLKELDHARERFLAVVGRFPKSEAARAAQEALEKLGKE